MRSASQVSVSHIFFKDFRNSMQETSLKGNASFPSQKRKKPRNFQLCFATFMHFPRGSRLLGKKKQLSLSWRRELRADNLEEQRNYTSEVVRQLTQQGFPYSPTSGQIQKDLPCFWVWRDPQETVLLIRLPLRTKVQLSILHSKPHTSHTTISQASSGDLFKQTCPPTSTVNHLQSSYLRIKHVFFLESKKLAFKPPGDYFLHSK